MRFSKSMILVATLLIALSALCGCDLGVHSITLCGTIVDHGVKLGEIFGHTARFNIELEHSDSIIQMKGDGPIDGKGQACALIYDARGVTFGFDPKKNKLKSLFVVVDGRALNGKLTDADRSGMDLMVHATFDVDDREAGDLGFSTLGQVLSHSPQRSPGTVDHDAFLKSVDPAGIYTPMVCTPAKPIRATR